MPMTPHIERHFTATQTVRNIVIGMAITSNVVIRAPSCLPTGTALIA